jgi:hypothetical protein
VKNDDICQEKQQNEQQKLKLVKKVIDCITDCCFDSGCVLMFKKLKKYVYQREKLCLIDDNDNL